MNVNLLSFTKSEYFENTLPTHYNKHDVILNAYKYDIVKCGLKYLQYKLNNKLIDFTVDGVSAQNYINSITDKSYVILIGKLIKENNDIYSEYLAASINFLENILIRNKYYDNSIIALKVYVDEIITNKKLIISDIRNKFNYTLKCTKIDIFVKRLQSLNKQMYITNNGINISIQFLNQNDNILVDIFDALQSANPESQLIKLSSSILSGDYSISKLGFNLTGDDKIRVRTYSGDMVYNSNMKIKYDVEYYHNIFKEISKFGLLSRNNF